MNIGALRHKITFKSRSNQKDTFGETEDVWVDFKTAWASITPVSGSPYYKDGIAGHEITHKIVIRYIPGIKENMQVYFAGRLFLILAALNIQEKNSEIHLLCKELIQ